MSRFAAAGAATNREAVDAVPFGRVTALPSREETDAAFAPFIVDRFPVDSAKWRRVSGKIALRQAYAALRHRFNAHHAAPAATRPQALVRDYYETSWASLPWPRTWDPGPGESRLPCIWSGQGIMCRRHAIKRTQLLAMSRLIAGIGPRNALEVGFGTGINLFVLSSSFPDIDWTGIELTEAGVAAARALQSEPELPQVACDYNPVEVASRTAHRSVDFRQGDATALPFPDASFDLVYTVQALEQMQAVRDEALREIRRVARRHVLMAEPFGDANETVTQQRYIRSRGYLDLRVAELAAFGLRPVTVFTELPRRLTLGTAVVLCEVVD